jgi:hypothetical protein
VVGTAEVVAIYLLLKTRVFQYAKLWPPVRR